MKKRDGIVWFSLVLVLVLVVVLFRDRIHFDWTTFWRQLKHANPWHIGAGIALTCGTYWLRAMRWSVFVSPTKKVSAGIAAGTAVHRIYGGSAVWAAGGPDAALPGGAADLVAS